MTPTASPLRHRYVTFLAPPQPHPYTEQQLVPMKNRQIIFPLVVVAIVLLLLAPNYVRRIRMYCQDAITTGARAVTWELESKTNSTFLVSMPAPLTHELAQLLTTPTAYLDTFRFGDEPPPLGDGTATHRVYIRNLDEQSIAIRLRYDPKLKKFHVLGFWTTNSWPE